MPEVAEPEKMAEVVYCLSEKDISFAWERLQPYEEIAECPELVLYSPQAILRGQQCRPNRPGQISSVRKREWRW